MNTSARKLNPTEFQGGASAVDDNRVIVTGENQFMRLSEKDGDPLSTEVSFWRTLFCLSGPGHALFLRSELTENHWRIYSDNIAMARWLQRTVQGMLAPDTRNPSIPVVEAVFSKSGDPHYFWTEQIVAHDVRIMMTWSDFGDPILVHSRPNETPNRPYGVCTVLVPALAARVTLNGAQAKGQPWPRDRMGRPFSTCGLGFSESWTEPR
jgi:hypothetical protein